MAMFRVNHRMRRDFILLVLLTFVIALFIPVWPISGQEGKQKAFRSPEEAMKILTDMAQTGDPKGMIAALGPAGEDIISSETPLPTRRLWNDL